MTEVVLRRAIGIMCVRLGWTQNDLEECAWWWLPFYTPSQAWAFMTLSDLEVLYEGLRDLERFIAWRKRHRPAMRQEPDQTRAPTVFGKVRKAKA